MLTATQSTGVTLEVNLRITQVRKHAKGNQPGFETQLFDSRLMSYLDWCIFSIHSNILVRRSHCDIIFKSKSPLASQKLCDRALVRSFSFCLALKGSKEVERGVQNAVSVTSIDH